MSLICGIYNYELAQLSNRSIYFLEFYNLLYINNRQVIDNNTLTAITLLIAESNPKEKDVLIDLVMNFLTNYN